MKIFRMLAIAAMLLISASAFAQTVLVGEFAATPNSEGYSLQGGTGDRTYIEIVEFTKAFSVPPKVIVSLAGYDATAGPDNTVRVQVTATKVTKNGFALRVKTWGDGRVGSVWGNWTAVGVK
jgi:acetoin utilization deacetylase AcuC-like enzyme